MKRCHIFLYICRFLLTCLKINPMLKKLQRKLLELHTSDFRFCFIQTQLCTLDSMSNNCEKSGVVINAASLESWKVGVGFS